MGALLAVVDSGRTVLVPNTQIAALLSDRIEKRYLNSGREVWATPRVRDFAGWTKELYEQQSFDAANAPRVLDDLEERELWRQVIAHSVLAEQFTDPGGAARAASVAWQAMQDFDIPLQSLASYPGAETQALVQWIEDFRARCRELRALPQCELLAALCAPPQRPVSLENPAWRPQARRWLETHAAESLPPMQCSPHALATASSSVFSSVDVELAECAHWAQSALAADPSFHALILLPNLALERERVSNAFDAALAPGRLELDDRHETPLYAIAGGVPLAGYEPVRLALLAAAAATGVIRFETFSALLRAPAMQSGVDDAATAARLDRELRIAASYDAPLTRWLSLSRELAVRGGIAEPVSLLRLRAMQSELESLARAPLSQWAAVLVKAWEAGPWASRATWSSVAFQSAQRLREMLHSLARASSTFGPLDLNAAVSAVHSAARDTAFQPQTGVAPIWISGQRIDPWVSFDGLWVGGVGAQEWPPAAQPLALLPVPLQRRYGVAAASAVAQAQDAADLLQRWRQRAPLLRFSCSSESTEAARVSPLLDAMVCATPAADRREPHWHWLQGQAPALEVFVDAAGPVFAADEKAGGVGSLKSQSLCAFRGFAEVRLNARVLEVPQPGFNPLERGIILHAAMEFIWRELGASQALKALDATRIQDLVQRASTDAVSKAIVRRDPGAVWQRRETRRLHKLLPQWLQLEAMRGDFEIVALEKPQLLTLATLDFTFRIDRIDRLADRRLLLLDYKSGTVRNDWDGERPDNPQLPLYASCMTEPLAAVVYARVAAARSLFKGIAAAAGILPELGYNLPEGGSMQAQLELWRARLQGLAEELREGVATVTPLPHACRDCSLAGLCRIDRSQPVADNDSIAAAEGL